MKQETLNKYINTTKGVLTVIDLDHEEYDKEKQRKRSYFKCYCNRCGKETIVRSDRFGKSNYKPKSCSNCVNDLQKQIAETKYPSEEKKLRDRVSSIIACANGRNYKMNLTREEIKEYLLKHKNASIFVSAKQYAPEIKSFMIATKATNFNKYASTEDKKTFETQRNNFLNQ